MGSLVPCEYHVVSSTEIHFYINVDKPTERAPPLLPKLPIDKGAPPRRVYPVLYSEHSQATKIHCSQPGMSIAGSSNQELQLSSSRTPRGVGGGVVAQGHDAPVSLEGRGRTMWLSRERTSPPLSRSVARAIPSTRDITRKASPRQGPNGPGGCCFGP